MPVSPGECFYTCFGLMSWTTEMNRHRRPVNNNNICSFVILVKIIHPDSAYVSPSRLSTPTSSLECASLSDTMNVSDLDDGFAEINKADVALVRTDFERTHL